MTPKLERDLAKQKAARTAVGRAGSGRPGANGLVKSKNQVESKAKSKAAHI